MGQRVVKRAFRYRFYPTPEQAEVLTKTFGSVRYVYNRALAERSRVWSEEQRRITYLEASKALTAWLAEPETAWLREVARVPLQQALRHLQAAYVNYWQGRSKHPAFKSLKKSKSSATFTSNSFTYRDGQIKLIRTMAPLDIRWSRPLPEGSRPSSVTVIRDAAGRWHISILCEDVVEDAPATLAAVGVDVGITSLATLSTGEKVANPKHEKASRVLLRRTERAMLRKQEGSANRAKAALRRAKVHARVADQRRDHLHKLSTRLIRENQTVIIEDLQISGMRRNRTLRRAITDASWFELRRQLEYKAAWYGRAVIALDRWFPSSKTCSSCGAIVATLPLSTRSWTCRCGAVHDRDVNAAKNILAEGLSVAACGAGTSPLSA